MKRKLLVILMILCTSVSIFAKKLKIGVTLQPYYSYVANVVGDKAEVLPVINGEAVDVHTYQPTFEDIKKLQELDILVVNGIGHDEFVFDMLKASENKNIKIINANENIPLMPISGTISGKKIMNPHTFISITASIQQVYTIAKELGKIDPENKNYYTNNAKEYAKKLRKLKADVLAEVKDIKGLDFRVATLHGGYDYLLSEFGITVKAVVEPAHGVQPSAAELKKVIDLINREKIDVLFGEVNFKSKFIDTIKKETGVEIRELSHLTNGPYTKESFEKFIKQDLSTIAKAMKDVQKKRGQRK